MHCSLQKVTILVFMPINPNYFMLIHSCRFANHGTSAVVQISYNILKNLQCSLRCQSIYYFNLDHISSRLDLIKSPFKNDVSVQIRWMLWCNEKTVHISGKGWAKKTQVGIYAHKTRHDFLYNRLKKTKAWCNCWLELSSMGDYTI